MKPRPQDSDDIERAVYDGMQDLRVRAAKKPAPRPRKVKPPARKRKK